MRNRPTSSIGATVAEAPGSHSIYVSQPQATADLIKQAAAQARVAKNDMWRVIVSLLIVVIAISTTFNAVTVALSVVLAFITGYGLTMRPLLKSGMALRAAAGLALASDTLSVATMEVVDNALMLVIPGAMASGTVTFSDGVTGKWMVDQYGRPGFTEVSKPGYRPSPADGQAFKQPLEEIARDGVPVQVLGFREHASWALASDTLEFVDLEDIPGVFREPLPRIGLDSLPERGAWLQPFRPLSSLLTSRIQ